jgi:type IV secretion system protein VirB2
MNRSSNNAVVTQVVLFGLTVFAMYLSMVEPTSAANIDLDPLREFLQSIVTALTGPLGKTAATLAVVASFITWLMGSIDIRHLLWILVSVVCIGSAATIVNSLWGGA